VVNVGGREEIAMGKGFSQFDRVGFDAAGEHARLMDVKSAVQLQIVEAGVGQFLHFKPAMRSRLGKHFHGFGAGIAAVIAPQLVDGVFSIMQ